MNSMELKQTHWISQQKLADDLNISVQRVHNWTKRKKIQSKYDKDIKMTLVNPESLDIKTIQQLDTNDV